MPSTPINIMACPPKDFVSEFAALALAEMLNADPRIETNYRDGNFIHQAILTDSYERTSTNSTSDNSQKAPFHTEHSHSERPDDFVFLLCLRGEQKALTSFKDFEEIIKGLPAHLQRELANPHFKIVSSKKHLESVSPSPLIAINDVGRIVSGRIHLHEDRIFGTTDLAQEALKQLRQLNVEGSGNQVTLEKGDGLIIRNATAPFAAHSRTNFPMNENPEERRWLQRMLLLTREATFSSPNELTTNEWIQRIEHGRSRSLESGI